MVRRHVGIDNVNTNDIQSSRGDPVRIESFEWDRDDDAGGNTAHISRHGISPEDVEEALTSNPLVLRGPDGRYLGYGKSADGRWIFVPFVQKGQGIVRPITARPMTDGEKRLYRKKRGKR